ncbi:MAG TPA: hypothetical protein VM935_03810 [Chitinophagaceae bacterium]|nr:hypothetical protein [Chitinophagaceae bacterium]
MKRTLVLLTALCFVFASYASSVVENPPKKASEIFVPIGTNGQKISLEELSQISSKEFSELAGRRMKLVEKLTFKLAQRDLRNSINEDGTINNKRLLKVANKMAPGDGGFHLGGFALGFLLGLIGVLIAYLIKDDKKKDRVKWSWFGVLAIVALSVVLAIL